MIAVVDYGAGNVTSVQRALAHLGHSSRLTADASEVARAERLIVPGVGHFGATRSLSSTDLGAALVHRIEEDAPLLGICLGMQWLFDCSAESAEASGLGALEGQCQPFPDGVKSPHVGWDQLEITAASRLLRGLASGTFVYFTHSYFAPVVAETVAVCSYGVPHSAAIERGNLSAVQFHPEKSGDAGLAILDNFCTC